MKNKIGKKKRQYQRILKKLPQLYEISQQLYINTIKEKRLETDEEKAWTVAFCYVLAPTLLLYVLWVLTNALSSGKRRLYFLARDGYMMYRAAEYICRIWEIPIDCRYLYCSRYALRGGEYKLLREKSLDYICLGSLNVTLEGIMQRGGLNTEEAKLVGSSMGMKENMHNRLTYEQIKALHPLLGSNPLFMNKMLSYSEEKYPNVIGYLRQEGLMEDVPYAIVDSGWVGSIQKSIDALLKSAGYKNKIEGYYFGLYEYAKETEHELYHTYYFAPENGNGKKALFCNNLFECIFSSSEGMTVGYCQKQGRYEPVLKQEENPNKFYIEEGTELLMKYVQAYTDERKNAKHKGKTSAEQRMEKWVVERLLSLFMGKPTREEAKIFGAYVFNDDVQGEEKTPVALLLSKQQLKERKLIQRLWRYAKGEAHPSVTSAWPEGSTVLAGGTSTEQMLQDTIYKFLLYSRKSLEQRRK